MRSRIVRAGSRVPFRRSRTICARAVARWSPPPWTCPMRRRSPISSMSAARELSGLDVVISNVSAGGLKGPDQWQTSLPRRPAGVRAARGGSGAAPRTVRCSGHRCARNYVSVRHIATHVCQFLRRVQGSGSATRVRSPGIRSRRRAFASTRSHLVRSTSRTAPGTSCTAAGQSIYESIRARIPIGRLGRAEEVARAVTFLASPAASFCTAVNLVVDGGFVSRVQF